MRLTFFLNIKTSVRTDGAKSETEAFQMSTRELLNLENAERDPVLLCTLSFVFSVSLFVSAWFHLYTTWHPCLG